MTYDLAQLHSIIKKRRVGFLIRISVSLLLMAIACVLIFSDINDTLTFLMIVFEFIGVFYIYRIFVGYAHFVLFSREIRGENVLEDEYIGVRKINYFGRYHEFGGKVRLFHTGTNRKSVNADAIRTKVYLKEENGNVVCLSDLYKSSTDVYEIGDTLVKYAGTKFPVVVSRAVEKQPCPICGEINFLGAEECLACGLKSKK